MKKPKFISTLFLGIIMVISMVSCDFLNTEGFKESDIYGTWTIIDASATIKVAGIDVTKVLITTFGYADTEAEARIDSLFGDLTSAYAGSISFNDDLTYTMSMTGESAKNGTWFFGESGKTVTITEGDGYEQILVIGTLTPSSLIVELPAEEQLVDLNDDGTDETSVRIVVILECSKE